MSDPVITYPLRIDTLSKANECGYSISVHCNTEGCWRHHKIDLAALADRLGRNHGSMAADLAPYFHCSRCRAAGRPDRNISFTINPPAPRWLNAVEYMPS
ncbi:MAG: hypothetical protein ABJG86_09645 [Nitratireductor sp.]